MYQEINQTIKHDIMALPSHVFRYFMCPAEFKSEGEISVNNSTFTNAGQRVKSNGKCRSPLALSNAPKYRSDDNGKIAGCKSYGVRRKA